MFDPSFIRPIRFLFSGPKKLEPVDYTILVLGLLTLVAPAITLTLILTFIGAPLAFVTSFIPAAFVGLLVTRLFHRLMGFKGPVPWVIAVVLTLGLSATAAYFANKYEKNAALESIRNDFNKLERPITAQVFAFVHVDGYSGLKCEEFCQRMLLTGLAEKFVTVTLNADQQFSPDSIGLAYWLEHRSACSPISGNLNSAAFNLSDHNKKTEGPTPAELINRLNANGTCLLKANSTLQNADTILEARAVLQNTKMVDRISLYQRSSNGLKETYRWTAAAYADFTHFIIPAVIAEQALDFKLGLLRTKHYLNLPSPYSERLPLKDFVTNQLQLNLQDFSVMERALPNEIDTIKSILTRSKDKPQVVENIEASISDFFSGISRRKRISESELSLTVQIYADTRIRILNFSWATIDAIVKSHPNEIDHLSNVLFTRLQAEVEAMAWDKYCYCYDQIDSAINALPTGRVAPFLPVLREIARNEIARTRFPQTLKKLAEFGEAEKNTFLLLIEEGSRFYRTKYDREIHGNQSVLVPQRVGLFGLCKIGLPARDLVPQVVDIVSAPQAFDYEFDWQDAIESLSSMGADREVTWNAVKSDKEYQGRRFFDRYFDEAKQRPRCGG